MLNLIKKIFMAVCFLSLLPLTTNAVPADPRLRTHLQANGELLHYYVVGDEHGHYTVTEDGIPISYDTANKSYVYATIRNSAVVNSSIIAKDKSLRTDEDNRILSTLQSAEVLSMQKQKRVEVLRQKKLNASSQSGVPGKVNDYPTIGKRNSPVILIQFSDLSFSSVEDPHDYYTRMLNEKGFSDHNGTGSASDYYYDNSCGLFDATYDVYGPVTVSKPHFYYAATTTGVADALAEACELLDGQIDFSQYDTNNDGVVDNVFYFYAGYGQADSGDPNDIWPCSWDLRMAKDTLICDGKYIGSFACSNEIRYNVNDPEPVPTGIGTFVHEFGHVLGLPDMYDVGYNMMSFTAGYIDLMDKGSYTNDSRTPPNLSGYERCSLGWVVPRVLDLSADSVVTIQPIKENDVLQVTTGNPDESFFLENRQQEGWDAYLSLHGMLVWHVDYDSLAFYQNVVNTDYTHPRYDLVEADGKATESTRNGDSYPGVSNITTCEFQSWDGETSPVRLEEINELDGLIRFVVSGVEFDIDKPANVKTGNVSQTAISLSWDKNPNALDYVVSVLQDGKTVYHKEEIKDGSIEINGLNPDTEYKVSLYAVSGINRSDSVVLYETTLPLPFNERSVVSLQPANISETGFTASWEPLKDAVGYELYVYNTVVNSETTDKGYDFAGQAAGMPSGWSTSSTVYSSVAGRYGEAAPSLRFSDDADYLTVSYPDEDIEALSFWYVSTKSAGKLYIDRLSGGQWSVADSIMPLQTEGTTVNFAFDDVQAVRIRYARESGYVTIDDVNVTVRGVTHNPVANLCPVSTGNVTSYTVDNLSSGNYLYKVAAINADGTRSQSYNEIKVSLGTTGVIDNVILDDGEESIYTVDGVKVNKVVNNGIYLIRRGNNVYKVIQKR